MPLNRIEVQDADAPSAPVTASFDAAQLEAMLQPWGARSGSDSKLAIAVGQRTIVFVCITLDRNAPLPNRLLHRVITTDSSLEGAVFSTQNTALLSLAPPLEGPDWQAADGPSNDSDNHHRRGVVILAGQALNSRRLAIDWKQVRDGSSSSGDARDVHSANRISISRLQPPRNSRQAKDCLISSTAIVPNPRPTLPWNSTRGSCLSTRPS